MSLIETGTSRGGGDFGANIQVIADGVTLDLKGFEIKTDNNIGISGSFVQVRNGRIDHTEDGTAIFGSGDDIIIENLFVRAQGISGAIFLGGQRGTVRDSELLSRSRNTLGAFARLERNRIRCGHGSEGSCVLTGDDSTITDNLIHGSFLSVSKCGKATVAVSNNTVVSRNTLSTQGDCTRGIQVNGNGNTIMHNLINSADGLSAGIRVEGELNILDGNILNSLSDCCPNSRGIVFVSDGNFYGNNRMNATVPFDLTSTVQTDWGGNVGF